MSFAVTAKLICVFVFAYAKSWFSHDVAHIIVSQISEVVQCVYFVFQVNSDASDTEENPSSGLKTVKSSDSIQSYFAKKMAEKKAKLNGDYVKDGDHLETATADKVEDDMSSRFDDRDELMSDVLINEKEEKKSKKKSKKSKKAKEEKVDDEGILFGKNNEIGDIECDSVPKVEKSDGIITDDVENVDSNDIENIEAASVKKMKKNKKSKKTKHEQVPDCDDFEEISENAKNESKVDLEDVSIAQVDEIKYKKSKKSKKSKKKDIKSIEKVAASNDTTNQGDTLQESDDICNKEDITSDNTTPKKKCKRSKKRTEATADGTDNHKSGENELHKSQTLVSEIEKNQTASSKKRKIEKGDNEMQNTKDTAKEVDNEGKESDNKRRRNGSDDFPNFDGDSAFNGANLSQIKGYSGLTQRVVVNGLKRRYSKKFQQK